MSALLRVPSANDSGKPIDEDLRLADEMPGIIFGLAPDAIFIKDRSRRTHVFKKVAGLWLAMSVLALVSPVGAAQAAVEAPRTIRVVMDNNYAPYSFQSEDGRLQGILIDQWQVWEKKTGIKVEIHEMDWSEAVRRMRAGEFDVIDEIVETTERRDYFDFTLAYATIEVPIFFRSDISGITDVASLKGFPVGIKEGDQHIDKLQAQGVATLIPFENNAAIIGAAKQHKINVFVADAPSVLYLLHKAGITAEFRRSAPIFRDGLRRAVQKGNDALLQKVVEGFAAIEPGELKQIDEKWFGRTINWYEDSLIYAGYAAGVTLLFVAGLVGWNRMLSTRVLERTAALAESEQRFRQIAENIREVFWLTTIDLSKVLYVSPAYEAVWGRSCESVHQDPRSFIAAIHPEDRARAVEALEQKRVHGFEVEYRVVRPDGSIRWIRDRGFPIKDETAHAYRIAGIAEDITERKLAAEAVKQAEDRTRLTIDTIPAMVWSVRPDGIVDFLNQPWVDYAGLSLEEYVKDPTGPIHPDDIPGLMEKWRANMAAGEPYEHEMRLRRADGVYRWFLVRTAPLRDKQGSIVKWFGSSFDIEDRKEAEEALQRSARELREREELYRLLTEKANDFVRVHDLETRSIYGSPSVERLYGRKPAYLFEFAHPEDLESCRQWWSRILAGSTELSLWRVCDREGRWRWMETRASLIQHQGQPHVMTVCRDVTERKEVEEALRGSEQQLHELVGRLNTAREDEAKRIARELHDDLGQKLTALNMGLAALELKLADATPGQRAQIARMHATVDQTIEVVQELSSELRLGQLDVLGLTAAIEWQLKEFSRRSKIPCTVTRLDEIAHLSDAQSTAVFRILQEALTNIVRHAGATRVGISLQAGPDELALGISDNGRGVTAAELHDRKAIGLLGMRERAQNVGGTVTITGETGRGTTVLVTIPLEPNRRMPA
jgi:PAS domain S-box-containing protein